MWLKISIGQPLSTICRGDISRRVVDMAFGASVNNSGRERCIARRRCVIVVGFPMGAREAMKNLLAVAGIEEQFHATRHFSRCGGDGLLVSAAQCVRSRAAAPQHSKTCDLAAGPDDKENLEQSTARCRTRSCPAASRTGRGRRSTRQPVPHRSTQRPGLRGRRVRRLTARRPAARCLYTCGHRSGRYRSRGGRRRHRCRR